MGGGLMDYDFSLFFFKYWLAKADVHESCAETRENKVSYSQSKVNLCTA